MNGDASRYPCPRCGEPLLLGELLDHIEEHAAHLGGIRS